MSFSQNPYVHMNLATAPPKGHGIVLDEYEKNLWEGKEDVVLVGCDSCGATDVARGTVRRSDPIDKARESFSRHIQRHHGRAPEDFTGWSWS